MISIYLLDDDHIDIYSGDLFVALFTKIMLIMLSMKAFLKLTRRNNA